MSPPVSFPDSSLPSGRNHFTAQSRYGWRVGDVFSSTDKRLSTSGPDDSAIAKEAEKTPYSPSLSLFMTVIDSKTSPGFRWSPTDAAPAALVGQDGVIFGQGEPVDAAEPSCPAARPRTSRTTELALPSRELAAADITQPLDRARHQARPAGDHGAT